MDVVEDVYLIGFQLCAWGGGGGGAVFFFFQAEDGIRDLVRSRGLGDVYKRQRVVHPRRPAGLCAVEPAHPRGQRRSGARWPAAAIHQPVSYTHLTLPTSDLV